MMRRHFTACLAVALLGACGNEPPAPVAVPPAAAAGPALDELVEDFFEEFLELNPVAATFMGDHRYDDRLEIAGPEYVRDSQALHRRYLDALRGVDRGELSPTGQLSYEVFEYGRVTALEAYAHPGRLLPLDQLGSPATFFAQMGSGQGIQPFITVQDYENFAGRMAAFPGWADQAIASMREGVARGIVQPRIVMERVLPQLASLATVTAETSVFWQPIAGMPAAFAAADRGRLTATYRDLLTASVIPAYRRLHDFVRDEYLPKTRDSVGLAALPAGAAWYDFLARAYTTTDTPVDEIHQIGLREVARLDAEIGGIRARIGFTGSVTGLADSLRRDARFHYRRPEQLLEAYRSLQLRVNEAVPRLFRLVPKAALEIRPMDAFREQAAPGAEYYAPSGDGTRPGAFYVNTWDLESRPAYEVEALYLHEAIPGHHFQIALAIENPELPRFRRFSTTDALAHSPDISTAYSEGWGLYAESLGDELGLYTDPYQKLGSLFMESWRAVRLVVDTGIHAKGWTREQAIDYMLAHSAAGRTETIAEIERYIALPGQALAYKTGQMKIRELRTRAETALGARFDVRAFHAEVLDGGAVPLKVLEARIGRWIEANRAGAGS